MNKLNLPDLKIHKIDGNNDFLLGNEITFPLGVRKDTKFLITPEMLLQDITDDLNATNEKLNTKVFASVEYNSEDKNIYFYSASGDLLFTIDATDFIKDGMLQSVDYDKDTATISFTFNTDGGSETINIDLLTLRDVYVAGDGISITDNAGNSNVVSIKLDDENESEFLTVSSAGLKLSGVAAINDYMDDLSSGNYSISSEEIDTLFSN